MSKRLQQLLTMLESSPKEAFLRFAIAKEYEKQADWENALSYYLKIETDSPDYVGLYYHLGKLYEQLDDFEKALSTYEKGMQVARNAGDQHALSELAGAKLEIDD
jgi:tetratricopeptide (TPR) repeat protein